LVTPVETSSTQVALLHRISNIVSSDQDIESILHEMVMLTMNVTHSDACLVYLIDLGTNEIVLRASQLPHDAEIGNVISSVVRGHRLTEGEIEKALLELRIPRAANVARISVGPESGFSLVGAEHAIASGPSC